MIWVKRNVMGLFLVIAVSGVVAQAQTPVALMVDSNRGAIRFAAGDLKRALEQNGYAVTELPLDDPSGIAQSVRIILTTQDAGVPGMPTIEGITHQGYAIQQVGAGSVTTWWVVAKDATGAMYGGLELAEAVSLAKGLVGVTNRQTNPYIENRGIKFNIPLDARSPSYSDDSDSAQANITNVWALSFWEDYFDSMARNRYNLLSLWNLHPFPSMVRVPEYPNVALTDVKKKEGALWDATLTGRNMYSTSWTLTTVKTMTMTMDEKIAFWRQVMQYAQDRGIQLYVFTWNIFVNGTEPSGYGITDKSTNSITTDYFRKSVKAMFNTYPLLAGIGVTVGENMGGLTSEQEEQWVWDSYGQGLSDAVADSKNAASPYYAPNRVIRLVHRLHYAEPSAILPFFQGLPGVNDADSTLAFSTKYSVAHMLSSTKPQASINDLTTLPAGKKTFLTIRNDDLYYLRWGDPDFARAYITNIPQQEKIAGFYMGPDGYTWGREYVSTEPDSPRQLVIDKMGYYFSLFGRLSYDPTIPNSRFEANLAERFPEVASSNLFHGWASVSKVMPLITRFYWGSRDFDWYPEACWSLVGFQTVQDFITPTRKPMNGNQDGERPLLMSVKDYVKGTAAKGRLTPIEVADLLQQYADNGLSSVQALDPGANKELRLTLGDIRAMGWLGRYYAEKIRGAVELHRYQVTGLADHHANARTHLIAASNHWSQYASCWSTQYIGQVLARMKAETPVDIAALQSAVNAEIPPPLDNPR